MRLPKVDWERCSGALGGQLEVEFATSELHRGTSYRKRRRVFLSVEQEVARHGCIIRESSGMLGLSEAKRSMLN